MNTPRTDAMLASVHGGMYRDGADGVTADEETPSHSEQIGEGACSRRQLALSMSPRAAVTSMLLESILGT
jgi:hypothetical protein